MIAKTNLNIEAKKPKQKTKLKRFSKGFRKVVHGCYIVTAKNVKEAQVKLDANEEDEEYENESDYELDDDWEEMGN